MQVTITDDCQMYIRLKEFNSHKFESSLAEVKCKLLYDSFNNFVGIKIMSQLGETDKNIELPELGSIEFPIHNADVMQNKNEIVIRFNKDSIIYKEVEDECILDLCPSGILGIEPMPYMNIGGKLIIEPFLRGNV
ncbi:hypothetical protein [Paenibacillus sp. FSL H8-0283]|uniref:hypothetical protein n=1 Tax=Paenibacillus sp. FSL H8-0283 TaxID=2921383 RepID=UPI003243D655